MKTEIIELTLITAEPGKVFKCRYNNRVFGKTLLLGYIYQIGETVLDVPIKESPNDYYEIDAPEQIEEK